MSIDPEYRRPHTDEHTGSLDHELFPAVRLSVVYTYRRESYPQATANPGNPFDTAPDDAARCRPRRRLRDRR